MTSEFIDTYLCCDSKEELEVFCAGYCNHLPFAKGREAVAEHYEEDVLFPATPQIGDPTKWYGSVRCLQAAVPTGTITVVDEAIGIALCGIWSKGKEF